MNIVFRVLLALFVVVMAGASSGCTGKCVEHLKEDCVCTMEYNPVCGCNNKTYPNACSAECAGIRKYSPGPCSGQGDKQ